MSSEQSVNPVYSYKKFKELADDRMSQVKIFVQPHEVWQPAGFGSIHLFQINICFNMIDIKEPSDFNPRIPNLYGLIETTDFQTIPNAEKKNLSTFKKILNTKNFKVDNVIMFYDFFMGTNFEYDIESFIKMKSHQLDT